MSLLIKNKHGCLIDHNNIITKVYSKVTCEDGHVSFQLRPSLFRIMRSKDKDVNRKRKRASGSCPLLIETMEVKETFTRFMQGLPDDIIKRKSPLDTLNISSACEVRDLATNLFESSIFDHTGISGGNNSDHPLKCEIKGNKFLLPQHSRFHVGCVKEQCKKLLGNKFDFVVADPPWWNKYIRRLKASNDKLSYSMMYNEDIASIPVKDLLSTNCLIAVWCTNSPSNITALKDIIFPAWGVEYVTTWYWLKVTNDMQPLCDFGAGSQKQPYERILIGKVGDVEVPMKQLIVSVPSALHSHKPPIVDLLSQCLKKENPQTLELFARYLLPNTTSVGFEPLKWQHLSIYEAVS
ncbi:hypothetical protein JYU34_014453 [Plutella xylostella]|uniref:Methyltransferase-like protein 4 n=1 Tax=Plutella xylostella TaxID=51655 RepID=A0ABQ7Q8B2_PLUXY|nr:hypothetical protein JYU34_014453 [Plutella xylostella]